MPVGRQEPLVLGCTTALVVIAAPAPDADRRIGGLCSHCVSAGVLSAPIECEASVGWLLRGIQHGPSLRTHRRHVVETPPEST